MKFILTYVLCFLICILLTDSRKYRVMVNDEFYTYLIDPSIPSYKEYFSIEHVIFEQVDDEYVRAAGYGLCLKSFNPDLPLTGSLRTQYLEKSSWVEGPIKLFVPNMCDEFLSPTRFWHNITKLWTNCPPQIGEKWAVESQIINVVFDLPPSFSKGPWRGYIIFYQGLIVPQHKFGFMFQLELIEV